LRGLGGLPSDCPHHFGRQFFFHVFEAIVSGVVDLEAYLQTVIGSNQDFKDTAASGDAMDV